MSRRLFAFLLSELKTVRLVCKQTNCGCVTELTLDRMRTIGHLCPVCNREWAPAPAHNSPNSLNQVAVMMMRVQENCGVEVEFVLPDDGKP